MFHRPSVSFKILIFFIAVCYYKGHKTGRRFFKLNIISKVKGS